MAKKRASLYFNNEVAGNGGTRYVKGTQPGKHSPVSQENVHLTKSYKQFVPQLMGAISTVIDPDSAQALQPWLYNAIPRFTQVNVIRDSKGNISTDFNIQKENTITNGVYSVASRSENVQLPTIMGVPEQWVQQSDGRWKYYNKGQAVSSTWVQYKGDYYFIESDQYMVTGWKTLDGNTYYFKTEAEDTNKDGSYGYRITDKWWKIDNKWYYFDSNGVMVTSKVITWGDKKYYVGNNGVMAENEAVTDEDGTEYWADGSGVLGDKPDIDLFIQTTVWNFFSEKFNDVQTAGIMGNAMQESTWNPLLRDKGHQYWGLFQLKTELSEKLESEYSAAGLDMNLYGYDSAKYQKIGAEKNIPMEDLQKILDIQLNFVYTHEGSGHNWIDPLSQATTVNEAAEVFLVKFEGAVADVRNSKNEIKYYKPYIGKYYQDAESRRNYAATYYSQFAN